MTFAQIKEHALRLLYSFLGAVAAAAAMAAVQWFGAHIPDAIQFLSTLAAAHGAQLASRH